MVCLFVNPDFVYFPALLLSILTFVLIIFLFVGVPIIAIVFIVKYFKQKKEYYQTKTEYYKNHMNDRQD